jgi:DNA-directed RNA polymerase subunit F
MGELGEERWAVISERGCEASPLSYAEAAALMRQLASEKVHGLCVVTNDAARYLPRVKSTVSTASPPAESAPQPNVRSK